MIIRVVFLHKSLDRVHNQDERVISENIFVYTLTYLDESCSLSHDVKGGYSYENVTITFATGVSDIGTEILNETVVMMLAGVGGSVLCVL